jgi:hypothetical protein
MVVTRGRKSAAAMATKLVAIDATKLRPRLTATARLSQVEQTVFDLVARQNRHLVPGDAVLLTAFSQAAARTFKASKGKDAAGWERSARVMTLLARSLRLTPQSVADPQKLARQRRDRAEADVEALWLSNEEAFGDDDEEPLSAAEQLRRFRAADHLDDNSGDDDDG